MESRPPLRFRAIRPTFYNFIDIPMGGSQMNWLLSLFQLLSTIPMSRYTMRISCAAEWEYFLARSPTSMH